MTTDADFLIFRKIAIRFLKEIGLFQEFKKYIKKTHTDKEQWYHKPFIDVLFGDTCFTYFLSKRGIYFKYKIVKIFRTYIVKKYGDKFKFSVNTIVPENDETIYNAETDRIIIKKL